MSERRPLPGASDRHRIILGDGRAMAYAVFGNPAGRPVLYCHGFPGSRLEARFADRAAARAEVCLLAPDRPGYGASDPRPGHTLADWSADAAALLDDLGLERVGVLGLSGGGPYALACAACLPDRVAAASLLAPLGPLDGPRGSAGMSWLARTSFLLARRRPGLHAALFRLLARLIRWRPERAFALLTCDLAAADRRVLADEQTRGVWTDSLRASVAQGADAAIDEVRRYARPWPFTLDRIQCRVGIWHGRSDRVVPFAHGRWLADHVPGAALHACGDHGHFSLPVEFAAEALQRQLEPRDLSRAQT